MSDKPEAAEDQPEKTGGPRKSSRIEQRRKARSLALQAFYQWQLAGASISQIEAEFLVDNDLNTVDVAYFRELLHGVPANVGAFDKLIEPLLDRPLKDVDPIELALLRLGAYELKERLDVPYRVVINEGVELAKTFGGTDGHKFVNGILDKLAGRLRMAEIQANRNKRT